MLLHRDTITEFNEIFRLLATVLGCRSISSYGDFHASNSQHRPPPPQKKDREREREEEEEEKGRENERKGKETHFYRLATCACVFRPFTCCLVLKFTFEISAK